MHMKIDDLIEALSAQREKLGNVYVIGADNCHITDVEEIKSICIDPYTDEEVKMVVIN